MITLLLIGILLLLAIPLVMVICNYHFRSYLPTLKRMQEPPFISLLVIGDNHIPRMSYLISLLGKISYTNLEIIIGIYNTPSESVELFEKLIQKDKRFRLLSIPQLEKGWKTDNYLHYRLGKEAKGAYLLFMNATLQLRNGILEVLVSYMHQHKLGMVTVFPTYDLHTRSQWSTLPLINQLLLTLFPLWKVRKLQPKRVALATNRFMLFERSIYKMYEPFEEVRCQRESAQAIASYYKSESIGMDCLVGDKRLQMESSVGWDRCLTELIGSLSFLLNRFTFLLGIYNLILLFWWVPFVFFQRPYFLIFGLIEILVTQFVVTVITRISFKKVLIYFFFQHVLLFFVLWISIHHKRHHKKQRVCRKN